MGFRTIVVNQHSKLSYKNNHLVFKSESRVETILLSEIDLLICETTDIVVTTMLLSKLVDEGVGVIFCCKNWLPSAQLMPFYGRHDSSLTLKKQLEWKAEAKDQLATRLIQQKMVNQGLFLAQRHFTQKSESIAKLASEIGLQDPTNREGHAARIFFNTLYGNSFSRDDVTPINAGLDYGYTLLMAMFAREIVKAGCITQLGINHVNQFNPFNLASDLMEPFRLIVDEIVYRFLDKNFDFIKREVFDIFVKIYPYNNAQMYLSNIVNSYVKGCIAYLNGEASDLPIFEYAGERRE